MLEFKQKLIKLEVKQERCGLNAAVCMMKSHYNLLICHVYWDEGAYENSA